MYTTQRRKVVDVAQAALARNVGMIEAVREMVWRLRSLPEGSDDAFAPLFDLEANTDDVPVGDLRGKFEPTYLASLDASFALFREESQRDFDDICKLVIARLGDDALLRGTPVVLYRPVGPAELELIRATEFRRFPPRLPDQPIFYPVVTESYAREIAEHWNANGADGAGFVLRFEVYGDFIARYPIRQAGNRTHLEYWIPAEELEVFNDHIVGSIEVIAEYRSK